MSRSVVEFEVEGQVALIRLNRPEVHNAVNEEVMDRLEAVLDRIDQDDRIRVIILTGAGKESFCAGGDLKYFATLKSRDQALQMSRRMQAILNRLYLGDRVVIAAINGQALGGGCEILTACHFRIAADHATFSFRQAANGIISGWGGGVRLLHLLGRNRALRLLLTAEMFDARFGADIGFLDDVVPGNRLDEQVRVFADKILQNSPEAVRTFLRLSNLWQEGNIPEAVRFETEKFADLWVGEDFREWLNRFLKK